MEYKMILPGEPPATVIYFRQPRKWAMPRLSVVYSIMTIYQITSVNVWDNGEETTVVIPNDKDGNESEYEYNESEDSNPPSLPNLTEQCQRAQIPGFKHRKCVYHGDRYPKSCKQASCQSVVLKVHLEADKVPFRISFSADKFADVAQLNEILDDETPCGESSWCVNGLCVPSTDQRVEQYAKADKVDGVWRNVYDVDNFDCLEDTDKTFEPVFKLMHSCADQARFRIFCTASYLSDNIKSSIMHFSPGFRVCDQPLPRLGGGRCWDKNQLSDDKYEVYDAMFVAKRCSTCSNKTVITGSYKAVQDFNNVTCLKKGVFRMPEAPDFDGVRCHVNENPGLCLFGLCAPDVD